MEVAVVSYVSYPVLLRTVTKVSKYTKCGMYNNTKYIYMYSICVYIWLSLFFSNNFLRTYLCIFREGGREGEREREKHPHVRETSIDCLSHMPNWGPSPQPRHVSWLGIEPATLHFAGRYPTHWATPVRARLVFPFYSMHEKRFGSFQTRGKPFLGLLSTSFPSLDNSLVKAGRGSAWKLPGKQSWVSACHSVQGLCVFTVPAVVSAPHQPAQHRAPAPPPSPMWLGICFISL